MFFKKQQPQANPVQPLQVKCETCKHYVDREDAQRVYLDYSYGPSIVYYCPLHLNPYDRKFVYSAGVRYYKTIPAHAIEVDENGKEIKKK